MSDGTISEISPVLNITSEEGDKLDIFTPESEENGQPNTRGVVVTAAEIKSARASVIAQLLSQPITSESTGIMLDIRPSLLSSAEIELLTKLKIMCDRGLDDRELNFAALRFSNDLESAIDIVLSGFQYPL